MEYAISPKEFCDSVAHDDRYQWKIAGYVTDDLLVLKRGGHPLVIKSRFPGEPFQYEWYKATRVR